MSGDIVNLIIFASECQLDKVVIWSHYSLHSHYLTSCYDRVAFGGIVSLVIFASERPLSIDQGLAINAIHSIGV